MFIHVLLLTLSFVLTRRNHSRSNRRSRFSCTRSGRNEPTTSCHLKRRHSDWFICAEPKFEKCKRVFNPLKMRDSFCRRRRSRSRSDCRVRAQSPRSRSLCRRSRSHCRRSRSHCRSFSSSRSCTSSRSSSSCSSYTSSSTSCTRRRHRSRSHCRRNNITAVDRTKVPNQKIANQKKVKAMDYEGIEVMLAKGPQNQTQNESNPPLPSLGTNTPPVLSNTLYQDNTPNQYNNQYKQNPMPLITLPVADPAKKVDAVLVAQAFETQEILLEANRELVLAIQHEYNYIEKDLPKLIKESAERTKHQISLILATLDKKTCKEIMTVVCCANQEFFKAVICAIRKQSRKADSYLKELGKRPNDEIAEAVRNPHQVRDTICKYFQQISQEVARDFEQIQQVEFRKIGKICECLLPNQLREIEKVLRQNSLLLLRAVCEAVNQTETSVVQLVHEKINCVAKELEILSLHTRKEVDHILNKSEEERQGIFLM